MADFYEIKNNLIEPQARAFKLAPLELDQKRLPCNNIDGRFTFLLSLSQKGAGGTGDWEAYRACVEDHITHSEETSLRLNDDTTKKLIDGLVADYKATGMGGEFFTDNDRGKSSTLKDFILRYFHYVLFGIDPDDKEKIQVLNEFHYHSASAAYHIKVCTGISIVPSIQILHVVFVYVY